MLNNPPGGAWYTDPKILLIGGVAIVVGYILLQNKQSATQQASQQATGPVGANYSYLDGNGMQHILATDPNGNMVAYNSLPPSTSVPQTNQLADYASMMGPSNMAYAPSSMFPYANPYVLSMPSYLQSNNTHY